MVKINIAKIKMESFVRKYGLSRCVSNHGIPFYASSPKGDGVVVDSDGVIIRVEDGAPGILFSMIMNGDVTENGTEESTRDLSLKQLNAFSSLISVLISMIPEKKFREMYAADLETGRSIPIAKFVTDNYAIVTNQKRTIKFKEDGKANG